MERMYTFFCITDARNSLDFEVYATVSKSGRMRMSAMKSTWRRYLTTSDACERPYYRFFSNAYYVYVPLGRMVCTKQKADAHVNFLTAQLNHKHSQCPKSYSNGTVHFH